MSCITHPSSVALKPQSKKGSKKGSKECVLATFLMALVQALFSPKSACAAYQAKKRGIQLDLDMQQSQLKLARLLPLGVAQQLMK